MDHSYYTNTPFHIPAYNNSYNFTPPTQIHPDSATRQLGLTPEELMLILWDKHTQPWPILTRPTTQTTTATTQLGLMEAKMEEVSEHQSVDERKRNRCDAGTHTYHSGSPTPVGPAQQ
jgi:hypothetical protein